MSMIFAAVLVAITFVGTGNTHSRFRAATASPAGAILVMLCCLYFSEHLRCHSP